MNLAALLGPACAPDEILISYETYAHVTDLIHCEDRGALAVLLESVERLSAGSPGPGGAVTPPGSPPAR